MDPVVHTKVFEAIGKTLENATETFVSDTAANTIAQITPWVLTGVTLYITLYAFMVIMGTINDPVKAGIVKIGKIMLISAIVLSAGAYMSHVVDFFTGIQNGLAHAFAGTGGGADTSIYATLDRALAKGLEVVMECKEQASNAGWTEWGVAAGWWLNAIIIGGGLALIIVFGGITLLMSTIYLKILFAIGPFFVASMFFPITQRFFDSWVGYVMNHILVVTLTALVLSLSIHIYDHEIAKIHVGADGGQNMLLVSLELLIVCAIMYAITKGILGMAAALAGGLQMAVLGVSGLMQRSLGVGRGARNVAHAGKTAASAGMTLATGAAGLASRVIHGANTVTKSSPLSYRRHVMEALNRK